LYSVVEDADVLFFSAEVWPARPTEPWLLMHARSIIDALRDVPVLAYNKRTAHRLSCL
jgi:hypothetical protein